ncbi:MAG: tail fiber domain-containing protein, partial [Candidatus Paceibacterota bacterium]
WTMRNAGGNFYLSTTTTDGTATTTTSALTILNGGNVGIGTTNPGASLEIYKNIVGEDANNLILNNPDTSANAASSLNFYGRGAAYPRVSIISQAGSQPSGYTPTLLFKVGSGASAPTTVFSYDDSGYVRSTANFRVTGSTSGSPIVIDGIGNTDGNSAAIQFWLTQYSTGPKIVSVSRGGNNADLSFYTDLEGALSEVMRLSKDGNVGIGTTTPYSLLSISNSVSTAVNTPLFTIASTTGGTATSTLVTVLASGNVGIGTTDPNSFQLQITGNGGKPGGGSWGDTSDVRLKKDIVSITGALDKLTQLNPVHFTWINPEEHGNLTAVQGGFIAQEVESVFPQWVKEGTAGGKDAQLVSGERIKTINLPFEFDAYVVGAIKELNDKITSGLTRVANIITDKLTTKELCLEDVCMTKTQLKELLEKNQINSNTASVVNSVVSVTEDSATTTTDSQQATTTLESQTASTTEVSVPENTETITSESTPTTPATESGSNTNTLVEVITEPTPEPSASQ